MIQSTPTRDGRRLHTEMFGVGRPTVVLEAGMGASRSSWCAVVPLVATETRVVVYDRSGLGRSPADPAPRTLDRLVDDHLDLLAGIGGGPFVLVGHSWGGPIVRLAAARAPELVRGLVLVDQTDEGCDLYFSDSADRQFALTARLLPLAARLGLLRLVLRAAARRLPEPAATDLRTEDSTVGAARTQVAELASSTDDLRRLVAEPPVLPDVPITSLSGTKASFLGRRRRDALVEAHRRGANRAPQGRHVTTAGSGHLIPLTEPALVAEEILRVVAAVREPGR